MLKWKLDDETANNPRVADFITAVCEEIAKDIDLPCKDRVLICSGGPYRGQDVLVKYNPDKKEIKVDFYSVIRHDYRQIDAVNYAKGLIKEACLTENYLRKKHPDAFKEKWEEWRHGMWRMSREDQEQEFREIISGKKPDKRKWRD